MKDSHYRVSLDIHSTQSQVSLHIKQGDTSRKVFISLCEGGKPYYIEDDCYAVFSAKKPDNTKIENRCIIEDNTIVYDVTEQTTAAVGKLNCEVKLYGENSKLLLSPSLTIIVEARAVSDDLIESSSEYSALTELYSETNALKTEMEDKLSSGYFNGKDGVDGKDGENVDYNLVSNALRGSASGEVVTLTDVSPLEHTMKVKVSDPSAVLTRRGKNLLPTIESQTYSGVTLYHADDGSYILDGTCTQSYNFYSQNFVLSDGIYTLSANNPRHNGLASNIVQVYSVNIGKNIFVEDYKANGTMTAELYYANDYVFRIRVQEGVTYDNFIVKPQLELGPTATAYEPYAAPQIYTPNADGTVDGVTSLYPTTTLICDTEGVTIDVEYNRDANKAFADMLALVYQSTYGRIAYIDLLASKWQGSESLYSQVVSIPGVTANSKVDLNPSIEQLSIFHQKDIAFVAENEDGVVTVYCVGQKPTANYQMQITVTEVIAHG